MFKHIKPDDYYSLILFDTAVDVVQPLQKFAEIDNEKLQFDVSQIKTRGGTDFSKGFSKAYEILQNELKKNN